MVYNFVCWHNKGALFFIATDEETLFDFLMLSNKKKTKHKPTSLFLSGFSILQV